MIGYKGFDKDLKCKGFQYRVGETYKFDGKIKICECGFHFCDIPTAVFEFHAPADSRFALVEATGSIANDGQHKFCTDEIKIVKELTLAEMIAMMSTVYTNTGDCSAASVSSKNSVAAVFGRDSKAKGALGCWLVLTEWNEDEIKGMQCFKVDGEIIKADIFYTLKNGKPIVADELEE